MVDLVRSDHLDAGLVTVSLRRGPADEGMRIAVPGRTRVVASNVADRLGQLVAAAVAHQRAVGRPSELDLDRLVERATADVARRRPRPEVSG